MDLIIKNGRGNLLDLMKFDDECLSIEIDDKAEMYLNKENIIQLYSFIKNNFDLDDVIKQSEQLKTAEYCYKKEKGLCCCFMGCVKSSDSF